MDSRSNESPKHTPGPWSYRIIGKESIPGYPPIAIYVANKIEIITQSEDGYADHVGITEADALLIAAAPDMLEALKALRNACWGGCACTDPSEEENAAWDLAEATIAKAEGRQP